MSKNIKEQLIQSLATGQFISGQELGDRLGVTRAAISNHIKKLTAMGLDIFSVTGRGYKLAQPLELLDHLKIQDHLQNLSLEQHVVEVHRVIDSTNSYLLRKIPNNIIRGQTCIAEYQQSGRGRRGRQWLSPFGSHIYLSQYWPLEQGMSEAMGLSLVIGIAISEVVQKYVPAKVQLKWPNDIYIEEQKVAGILIELEGQAQGLSHCVVGVGLNIQMPISVGKQIDQPWTDLVSHCADKIDRNKLVAKIIYSINKFLVINQKSGFASLLRLWHSRDIFLNKRVKVITGDKESVGIYRGVNAQGGMLLEVNGQETPFYGGEVSLRGVE